MAGRPKGRAKRDAQIHAAAAAAAEIATQHASPPVAAPIPDAVVDGATARTRTRTPAPAWRPAAARPAPAPGPELRAASDAAQARTVRGLHEHLLPGVTLRLIRTRPAWAMGWVEDLVVDDGEDLTDVYEHVASEHGGTTYQVTALSGGHPLYEGRISIAGKPRHHGKLISRRQWQGLDDDDSSAAAAPASPASQDMNALSGFLGLFMEQQRATAAAQLESVRQMTEQAAQTQRELVAAVVAEREREREGGRAPTFAEQLGEFVEASSALDKAKKRFGAAAGGAEKEDTSQLSKVAMESFMTNVMQSFAKPAAPVTAPQPAIRAVPDARVRKG